jgi:UDP-glucose 4-epimerase
MKIAITGASGFIGSAIAKKIKNDHELFLFDICGGFDDIIPIDLCDKLAVEKQMPDVDLLFHFSAYNNTRHFYTYPYDVFQNTLVPTLNLIDRYKHTSTKFIYAGSSESYSGGIQLGVVGIPTKESVPLVIDDISNPRISYASAKIASEAAIQSAHLQYGMHYLTLRYHNVYGPGQRAHFINEYIDRARAGDYRLPGAHETRAFVYIDDAVRATIELAINEQDMIVNVGNPRETTILEVAEKIHRKLQIQDSPIPLDGLAGSVKRRCPDVSLMLELLGGFEFMSLDQGISKCMS